MNIITISVLDELQLVINVPLCISERQSEEIANNMWCITLEKNLISTIKIEQLKQSLDELITNRECQLKYINVQQRMIFYMWVDRQALQLRLNVITGSARSLPFECKVRVTTFPISILSDFVNMMRNIDQYGEDVDFFDVNDEDNWDEDEDKEEYLLDVFVKELGVGEVEV